MRIAARFSLVLLVSLLGGCASVQSRHSTSAPVIDPTLHTELTRVLNDQAAAWNRGDIDGFMQGYWKSESLTFNSGGKTTRGWQATRDRYRLRYPDRAAMGTLTFSDLESLRIDSAAALLLGRWHLQRADDSMGGNFSLVMRCIDGRWLIIHDHTSSD